MSDPHTVSAHYSRGDLLERLAAALLADGADPARPTPEALAPYDQFHGRGIEATADAAAMVPVGAADHLLDVGSGIGGPARYFAHRFGCRVTGIDLTAEFCEVARHLTRLLELEERVRFEHGNALAMPFEPESFEGAYSMNVSMNIADKPALYHEIRRVLKPGGWLLLSEIARGTAAEPEYPTPWARNAETSFLATVDDTLAGLAAAGFDLLAWRSTRDESLAFGDRSRAMVARGEKPPHRAMMLVHPEFARAAMANSGRGLADGRLVPVEILCRRRD